MCAYKVVRADFKYFGLQGTVEGKIRDSQRDLFNKTLCQAYATLDRWVDKSMADVRAMEGEVRRAAGAGRAAVPRHTRLQEQGAHTQRQQRARQRARRPTEGSRRRGQERSRCATPAAFSAFVALLSRPSSVPQVARKSEAVVIRLREKGEAPPLANDGYWAKGAAAAGAGAGAAAAGAAVGGAGGGGGDAAVGGAGGK
jgi:hypothetical protein